MSEHIKILYEGGETEIVVKKSRFIATTAPVRSEEGAIDFITDMKKKYRDATHNCSAYTVGSHNEITHCSDDGEPSQTAGKPMLDVLLGEDIHDACVVVTRYFGGTLLGTGGLVRAYSDAVKEGLRASVTVDKENGYLLNITTDYTFAGKIQYIASREQLKIMDSLYTDRVKFTILVPEDLTDGFEKMITEATAGKAVFNRGDMIRFAFTGDDVTIF